MKNKFKASLILILFFFAAQAMKRGQDIHFTLKGSDLYLRAPKDWYNWLDENRFVLGNNGSEDLNISRELKKSIEEKITEIRSDIQLENINTYDQTSWSVHPLRVYKVIPGLWYQGNDVPSWKMVDIKMKSLSGDLEASFLCQDNNHILVKHYITYWPKQGEMKNYFFATIKLLKYAKIPSEDY